MTDIQTLPVITDDPERWRLVDGATGVFYVWDGDLPGWVPKGARLTLGGGAPSDFTDLADPNGVIAGGGSDAV